MSLEKVREERQRVEARLAKLAPEVAKLNVEIVQLTNAEEVLLRLVGEPPIKRRGRPPRVQTDTPEAPRATSAEPKEASPLSGMVLKIVEDHPDGIDQVAINAAVQIAGLSARANHVGIALNRHLRGGRLEQRDGLWFPVGTAGEQQVDDETEEEREAAE